MTKTSVIKVAELDELVDCYLLFKRNNQDNSRLMELIANQTEYMQKRYWKLVTAALKANDN